MVGFVINKGLFWRSVPFHFPFVLEKYSSFCLIKNKNLTILSVVNGKLLFFFKIFNPNSTFVLPTWNTNFPLTPTPPCDHFLNYNESHPSPPPKTIKKLLNNIWLLFENKRHSGKNWFWKKNWNLYTVRYNLKYVLQDLFHCTN